MEILQFRTNIKCGACVNTVTPVLNDLKEIIKWEVDLANPDRILSVQMENGLASQQIVVALNSKGYNAELL